MSANPSVSKRASSGLLLLTNMGLSVMLKAKSDFQVGTVEEKSDHVDIAASAAAAVHVGDSLRSIFTSNGADDVIVRRSGSLIVFWGVITWYPHLRRNTGD